MKHKIRNIKTISILLILCSLHILLNTSVHAQQRTSQIIKVSPVILNITLDPGKTYVYPITITNFLDTALPLRVSFTDFDTQDKSGAYILGNTQSSPLISWSSIDKSQLILNPYSSEKINLTIHIPQKVPFGGYYATMFLQPLTPFQKINASAVVPRIGVLLLANVSASDLESKKASILNFDFTQSVYEKGPPDVRFAVKNESLYHYSVKPFVLITPLIGRGKRFSLVEKFVFPGKTRIWENLVPLYTYGLYKATLDVSLGQGKQISESRYIVVFPIVKCLEIMLGIVLFLFLVKKRGNLKKATKSLLGKNT